MNRIDCIPYPIFHITIRTHHKEEQRMNEYEFIFLLFVHRIKLKSFELHFRLHIFRIFRIEFSEPIIIIIWSNAKCEKWKANNHKWKFKYWINERKEKTLEQFQSNYFNSILWNFRTIISYQYLNISENSNKTNISPFKIVFKIKSLMVAQTYHEHQNHYIFTAY